MTYPTAGEYQEAVQFPSSAFSDPMLQAGEPEMLPLGIPRAITGAFAVVFPIRMRGARWAVKCFLKETGDQRRRYRAIAAHLQEKRLPYTAEFDYQSKGIRVQGRGFPLLKMEWVDGAPISRFVEEHLESPDTLQRLQENWRRMIRDLEEAGMAHGDLQHGNVLVDPNADLHLVDYDTMYVPALRRRKSPEVGHRNYQHPDRDESDFGPHLDRFSALVIDTAIQACIGNPDLWHRFDTGENLLFRSSDFYDPESSPLFEELADRAEVLRAACYGELEQVPSLDEVAEGSAAAAGRRRFFMHPHRRPRWRSDRHPHDHPRAVSDREFGSAFERWFAPAAAVVAAAAVAVAMLGSYEAALLIVCLAVAAGLGSAWWRYLRLPSVRRRRRIEREEAYLAGIVKRLEADLARLEADRADFLSRIDARYEQRLAELREEALRDRLKHHFIGDARAFDGITHKMIVRLKVSGIRTAYQATPERVDAVRQLAVESKARVNSWRASLAERYQTELPTELSPAEERRVRRSIDLQIEEMDDEIARLRARIDTQKVEREQLQVRIAKPSDLPFSRYLMHLLRRRRRTPQL